MTTLPTTVQERITQPLAMRGGGPDRSGPPTATEILAMLRRRAVLITALFFVLSAVATGGFAVWWIYFPGYRAEALVECISNIPEAELTVEQQRLNKDEHERFVMTQAMFLKSPRILEEALKITAVRETHWYRRVAPGEHMIELTEDLRAAPVRGTNFLRVAMDCRKVRDPAVIVNEVVNQWFQTATRRSAEELANESLDAARAELEAVDREVIANRDRLKVLAQRLPPGARHSPGGNITHQQVEQLAEQVGLLQLELAELEQFRSIYNDPGGVSVTAEDRAIVEQDPQVAELARTLFLLEQQRAADADVYGNEHSVLRQLDAQIRAARDKLVQLRSEKLQERRADIREAANTAYDNTRHALYLTQDKLIKAEAALQDQDRMLFDYFNLEDKLKNLGKDRLELDKYIKSLSRIKAQRTAINVSIAQPAVDPLERHSPSLWLIPVGIFLALALSIGTVVGLEAMDTSVRTTQDIVRHLDVAMLGLVPHTDDEEVDIQRVETAVRDVPRSMVAEAFRQIRTNLQFSAPVERQRSVLVTSPRPKDGTTTVACNLAISLAQNARRVLLIDANFRRPALQELLGTAESTGLSNLLIKEGSLESAVVATDVPLLSLLGAGPTPPNPTELLGSEQLRALLAEAVERYDQVIIDTAPVLLASDAAVLAPAVDGLVLVVRASESSRGIARRAIGLLNSVGAHMFGAVLNAAQVRRGGYFREQLRAYYDYQPNAGSIEAAKPRAPKTPGS